MQIIEDIKRLRNEFPELGLVGAKNMRERYGSYEAAKAAMSDGRIDPETQLRMELVCLRGALNEIYRESAVRDLMQSDIAEIAARHKAPIVR